MSTTNALTSFLIPIDTTSSRIEAVALMQCLASILDERIDKITLFHVTEGRYLSEHMANIDSRAARIITTDLFKKLRQDHIDKTIAPVLEQARTELEKAGITAPIDILIEDGDPVERIVELANNGEYSSLILERHAKTHDDVSLGHVASGILHRDVQATVYLTGIRPVICPPECCLVALDDSKNSWMALERAGVLAAASGSRLKKIILTSVLDASVYSLQLADGREEINMDSTILDRAEKLLMDKGIAGDQIIKRIALGDPADILVQKVKNHGVEFVFMGRRDRGALKELFMGSVSNQLIHHCPEQTIVMFG
jgi:nucleotide-binding universal stress UspA family protein